MPPKPKRGRTSYRKVLIDSFPDERVSGELIVVSSLSKNLSTLNKLAQGGLIVWEEEYVPAGLLFKKFDKIEVPMFPDKEDDELVLVKKIKKILAPDQSALKYMIDRAMGKPAVEPTEDTSPNEDIKEVITINMGSASKNHADTLPEASTVYQTRGSDISLEKIRGDRSID